MLLCYILSMLFPSPLCYDTTRQSNHTIGQNSEVSSHTNGVSMSRIGDKTVQNNNRKKRGINRFANHRYFNQCAHETTLKFSASTKTAQEHMSLGLGNQYLPLLHAARTSHSLFRLALALATLIPLLPELQNLQLNALLKPLLEFGAISEEKQNLHPDE